MMVDAAPAIAARDPRAYTDQEVHRRDKIDDFETRRRASDDFGPREAVCKASMRTRSRPGTINVPDPNFPSHQCCLFTFVRGSDGSMPYAGGQAMRRANRVRNPSS